MSERAISKAGRAAGEREGRSVPVLVRGLRKEFDGLVAVDGFEMRIDRGVLYGLIGPNGSGKTTAIKMLVGLLRPSGGEAYVLGEKVPGRANVQRVGYMPQEMAVYPDLTIHENMELFAELYSVSRGDFDMREKLLLDVIDLKARRDSLVSQLSGGMKHRTSLACTLVHDPELLFLDEPTVGVDPELRVGFWEYFQNLKARGKTVVLTTHYMDEAVRCDIVGMMRAGRLIAEGAPRDLMAKANASDLESAFMFFSRGEGA